MDALSLIVPAFGFRKKGGTPNIADGANATSVRVSERLFDVLGVAEGAVGKDDPGRLLEEAVRAFLAKAMLAIDERRNWSVDRKRRITDYEQYAHLAQLDKLIKKYETIRTEIGRDYLIKPDVCVSIDLAQGEPTDKLARLHAAVSCKWTLRSDRAQNVRHEAVMLIRHRRGRLPHIVTVTCEPLPTRLAALARGTGEVDGVYHVALNALSVAVAAVGTNEQQSVLSELVNQHRLFDLSELPAVLAD